MNRFPASQVLGGACETVACGVEDVEDSALTDVATHGKKRDAGRGPP